MAPAGPSCYTEPRTSNRAGSAQWRQGRAGHPILRHDRRIRRDLDKYLRNVPKKKLLLEWAEQQRVFTGPVLVVWAREDKLMPPEHAERLAEHFDNAELVWVDDSRTLIPIDQPEVLVDHLERFLERATPG